MKMTSDFFLNLTISPLQVLFFICTNWHIIFAVNLCEALTDNRRQI